MSSGSPSSGSIESNKPVNPILRNALRYSLSPHEYQLLHKYLLTRASSVKSLVPKPANYENAVKNIDDYNAETIRLTFRLAASTWLGLKVWEEIVPKLFARGKTVPQKIPMIQQTSFRLSSSLGMIFLFHRLMHRFLQRLRLSLLHDNARPFKKRNPRVHGVLTAKLAPVIGSGFAGFFLGILPATQLRLTMTIYMFTRSSEFLYSYLNDLGYFKNKPWWVGSWLLMPAACGQLLHALVFDRDCFPAAYGNFILGNSSTYLQGKPVDFPSDATWPTTVNIVDNLGEISKLGWPKFISPIMFPRSNTLPSSSLSLTAAITSAADPTIQNLSCALIHPHDPSCLRTYFTFFLQTFPGILKYFSIFLGAMSLLRVRAFIKNPVPNLAKLAQAVLRTSIFITGAIGTAWGSICLLQNILPKRMLATKRWFLGGALGGAWAFLVRGSDHANFMFSTRLSIDSFWKVGVKQGWWKGIKNGDVLLFTASLVTMQLIYENDPKAVDSPMIRKALSLLRGEGWIDKVASAGKLKATEEGKKEL